MANISVERIQAASAGSNNDASPDYLAAGEAALLENLQPGSAGKLMLRGVLNKKHPIASPFYGRPDAVWTYDDFAYVGAGADYGIAIVGSSTVATGSTPATAPSSSVHARVDALVFGAVTNAAATGFYPKLGKFDFNALTITEQSTAPAPTGFTDVKQHLTRLFVLGGTKPGTTTPLKPRSLFWSDPGGPVTDALASWQDDVSGLVNEIVFSATDTPVGLARCTTTMAILTNRSIYLLTGTGSSSFAVRLLSTGFGCIDARTIVETDDGFMYLSDRGFCFCDGSTIRVVSKPIHGEIKERLRTTNTWSAAAFNDGYIGLCDGGTGGRLWLLHIESGAWTTLRSDLWPNGDTRGCYVARATNRPVIWDGESLWDGRYCTSFEAVANPNRAIDTDGDSISPTTADIPATWHSRVARLSAPSNVSTTQRLLLDYRFEVASGSAVTPTLGWYVSLVDGQGNVLLPEVQVPVGTTGFRKRFQVEVFAEATEVQVRATWRYTGAPPGLAYAELYDAWLEYVPGQNRATG